MGMFDSVYVTCPRCGSSVEFQSKAGECYLRTYSNQEVPTEIAADLNDTSERCKCGALVTVRASLPSAVYMEVTACVN